MLTVNPTGIANIKPMTAKTLFGENPMATDGFEFLEFSSPDPQHLAQDFENLGFKAVAKHKSKDVVLYQQGNINFILNKQKGMATDFANNHGAGACAMGFRVLDADYAYKRALELGAEPYVSKRGLGELEIPAIQGIGGTVIYFIDKYGDTSIYETDFQLLPGQSYFNNSGQGLTYIDHVTHNVHRGQMDVWANFYEKLFNFKEIRYFDIEGKLTGLVSRAMTSPCGKIRIPLNEGTDDKSQIEEFLREFNGEGIQHIALGTNDIYSSVARLKENGINFLDVPDTYYEMLDGRVKNHNERNAELKKLRILVDKLINAYKCKPGARIPISGVLSTSGLNSAFFLDTGDWAMNVSVIDPDTNKIITIPNLFSAHFENGGFKIELSYNWIFVFIPADISVQSLNNAIYGRGITLSFSPLFGLETGWTPGNNRPGSLFYGSFKMGIAGGISFPKIKFEMNKIYQ